MNAQTLPNLASTAGVILSLKLASTGGERGPEYHGPCPLCGGKDRFHVWPEQHPDRGGSFWCRGCGKAGDGIQFLREFGGLSFRDACRKVGKKIDSNRQASKQVRKPWKSTPVTPLTVSTDQDTTLKPRSCSSPEIKWCNQARKYVDECRSALLANSAALEKLQRERGITRTTAERFNLGLLLPRAGTSHPCRYSSRTAWGLPLKEKAKRPDSLWLPRGLVIPCSSLGKGEPGNKDPRSEIIRLRIRRPATDLSNCGAKYFVVPGSSTAPLLVHDRQPVIAVVESELDAMLLCQEVGDLCGVLAVGNSSARPDAATDERLQAAGLILLAFDNDVAGHEAAERWQRWYENVVAAELPSGVKDPGELYQAGGKIRGWIKGHLPSVWTVPGQVATERIPEEQPSSDEKQKVQGQSRAWEIRNRDGLTYYVVTRSADKQQYAKEHKTAFTIDEIKKANQMPEEMRKAFLEFCCAFPGSRLIDFRRREATEKIARN